jgi:cyclophilin family peptidyl-prolyl cis-trans isomerase
MNTITRWIVIIIVIVLVLAAIQWYLNSRPDAYFNEYGNVATSTQSASSTSSLNSTGDSAAAVNAVNAAIQGQVAQNVPQQESAQNTNTNQVKNFMHTVTIETSKGTIVFQTYDNDAPNTVKNFITLAGKGFYNNLIFHRVIQNFMIQGGDPTGTGMGGPGYQFADELNPASDSYKAGYVRGAVAMANAGPNTNGSQFFIMQKDTLLPHNYTIFGKVISGMEVVDAIAASKTNSGDKPVQNIVMKSVTVK